jgi:hypothetical protein
MGEQDENKSWGWPGMFWIYFSQERIHWRILRNEYLTSIKNEDFLVSWATTNFSRKILFHGVTEDIERETECSETSVSAHMGIFIHFIRSSTALQPFVGPWPLIHFRNLFYTDGRTPWTSDQSIARPLPTHRTTQTQYKRTHRHPCLQWDSNARSQRSSRRRQFMP